MWGNLIKLVSSIPSDTLVVLFIGACSSVAVITTVIIFLRSNAKRDEMIQEAFSKKDSTFDRLAKECHDRQIESQVAYQKQMETTVHRFIDFQERQLEHQIKSTQAITKIEETMKTLIMRVG